MHKYFKRYGIQPIQRNVEMHDRQKSVIRKEKAQYPAIAEEDFLKIGKYFNQIMDEEKLQ